jgi:hypothetical protein
MIPDPSGVQFLYDRYSPQIAFLKPVQVRHFPAVISKFVIHGIPYPDDRKIAEELEDTGAPICGK